MKKRNLLLIIGIFIFIPVVLALKVISPYPITTSGAGGGSVVYGSNCSVLNSCNNLLYYNNQTWDRRGTDVILANIGDRVGIGTATPSHKLNVIGSVNITKNITGNQIYGGMWYHNHSATELTFEDGVFYNLFMVNATHLNGFTFQGGRLLRSNLTSQVAGLYQTAYMSSGDGRNNHIYFTSVFVNNVNLDNCESHKKMTAGGDIVTMTGTCLIRVQAGDEIDIRTADIGGSGTGNYYSSNLNLVRIGD